MTCVFYKLVGSLICSFSFSFSFSFHFPFSYVLVGFTILKSVGSVYRITSYR